MIIGGDPSSLPPEHRPEVLPEPPIIGGPDVLPPLEPIAPVLPPAPEKSESSDSEEAAPCGCGGIQMACPCQADPCDTEVTNEDLDVIIDDVLNGEDF